jgi:hypothetical protein
MTQLAAPYLNQTNGTIINLASDIAGKPVRFKLIINDLEN